jgi:hypothetical protein
MSSQENVCTAMKGMIILLAGILSMGFLVLISWLLSHLPL